MTLVTAPEANPPTAQPAMEGTHSAMTSISAPSDEQQRLATFQRRQGVLKFRPECPPRETIERLLDEAVQAPNHHLNQPWRFVVMAGKAREALGEAFAERQRKKVAGAPAGDVEKILQAERAKPLRAPVVIAVAATRTDHPKAMQVEDLAATAAAAQTILLAAPSFGLGAYWRTGDAAYDPDIKAHLGLKPEDDIVGFIYVGYPDGVRPVGPRVPAGDKAEWRGWAE
jgi:nitroreductase